MCGCQALVRLGYLITSSSIGLVLVLFFWFVAFSRERSKKVEASCFDPFFEGNTGVDDLLVGSRYMYIHTR